MYETSARFFFFFQMKCSFRQTSPGASLNFSVLLPMWLLLICHGFVHVMRLWPAHILKPLLIWSKLHFSDSYFVFFFFFFEFFPQTFRSGLHIYIYISFPLIKKMVWERWWVMPSVFFLRHSDIKEAKLAGGNPLFSSPGLFLDSAVPGTAAWS